LLGHLKKRKSGTERGSKGERATVTDLKHKGSNHAVANQRIHQAYQGKLKKTKEGKRKELSLKRASKGAGGGKKRQGRAKSCWGKQTASKILQFDSKSIFCATHLYGKGRT